MTFNNTTIANELYPISNGTTSSNPFVVQFQPRDPTTSDIQYPIQKVWLNTTTNQFWFLKNFLSNSGVTLANWITFSGSSTVETVTGDDGVVVNPVANNINLIGNAVANATHAKPLFFRSGGDPNEDLDLQVSNAVASSNINNAGISSFNNAQFTVDANGFVSMTGGGAAIEKVEVDAFTGPGTNPVLPDGTGTITVTGGQVAAGTTANVIRTDSLAANTYTVEIQRSQAVASSTIGDNGVSHFNSTEFTVDSNGFVSIIGGLGFSSVNIQKFSTSGTYTPTSGMAFCIIELVGGGGGSGGVAGAAGSNSAATSGGSGGGYARGFFSASAIGVSQVVTVGAGGTAGAAGNNAGGTGGTTSVGILISATGGAGSAGQAASGIGNSGAGGAAGTGSGGSVQISGGIGLGGGWSNQGAGNNFVISGYGGGTVFGPGAIGNWSGPGVASVIPGTGAGGAATNANTNTAGGAGSAGLVIITEFIIS